MLNMHVHVLYYIHMRTTVDLTQSQRARLLKLAAERGEKGYSSIVQEAVDCYLDDEAERKTRVKEAVLVLGTLDDAAADQMTETARALRDSWR